MSLFSKDDSMITRAEYGFVLQFWNIKVVSRPPAIEDASMEGKPFYAAEEAAETHESLKDKQQKMEQKVYRIWTHLSAFEESSAACISELLRHVSAANYLDVIRQAEKFILHVEVLFAAIDDLEGHFAQVKNKGTCRVKCDCLASPCSLLVVRYIYNSR